MESIIKDYVSFEGSVFILKSIDHQMNSKQFTRNHQKEILFVQPRTKMFPALIPCAYWEPVSAWRVHLQFTR
jgi:hypothetical protein